MGGRSHPSLPPLGHPLYALDASDGRSAPSLEGGRGGPARSTEGPGRAGSIKKAGGSAQSSDPTFPLPPPHFPAAPPTHPAVSHALLFARLRRMAAEDHPFMYGAHSLASRFASADPRGAREGEACE